MTSKNNLPLVNSAMIECMAVCFVGDKMLQAIDKAGLLLKSFEKAVASSAQVNYRIRFNINYGVIVTTIVNISNF